MEEKEIDTWQTDSPTCPHCGFVDQDAEWYYDDDVHDGREYCSECGRWFTWESEVSISFSTKKTDWVEEWKRYNRFQVQIAELKAIRDNKGS